MKTREFIELLESASHDQLISYTYQGKHLVPSHYHVTEVKQVKSKSVDCGGNVHQDSATILQLHTMANKDDGHRLQIGGYSKLLSIVKGKMEFDLESPIHFEYGDSSFHAAALEVKSVNNTPEGLQIDLQSRRTACKPALTMTGNYACC